MMPPDEDTDDLWVFAYGSLLWNPGFPFAEAHPALVRGYHRSLCVYSHVHRGTPERPGLVLGLDRGGACRGLAYRVAGTHRRTTLAYLREREQATSVYIERALDVELAMKRWIRAVAYIVDRNHIQYAGRLSMDIMLQHVRNGRGRSGDNVRYVLASIRRMIELGVRDASLESLARRISEEAAARTPLNV